MGEKLHKMSSSEPQKRIRFKTDPKYTKVSTPPKSPFFTWNRIKRIVKGGACVSIVLYIGIFAIPNYKANERRNAYKEACQIAAMDPDRKKISSVENHSKQKEKSSSES